MADILGRRLAEHGGSLSIDDVLLTFPGLDNQAAFIPFIITNLNLSYGQQISRFYGLNLNKVFLVSGRAQGNAAMQQVISPQGNMKSFYETYGNVCNAQQNVLQFSMRSGCSNSTSGNTTSSLQRFLAGLCIANQLSVSTTSDNPALNNSAGISFESLEYITD